MTEFEEVLLTHLQRYPLMGPEDCAKLIYQSEFAGEHMIADAGQCLEWIRRELDETEPRNGEIYEDIGSGVFRLHFGPAKAAGMDAREINERFISSAARASGTKVGQEQKLMLLEELCRELARDASRHQRAIRTTLEQMWGGTVDGSRRHGVN